MILSGPSDAFKCLACKSPRLLQNLDSLKVHFATEHGVLNLLSSPATQTVLPPSTFSCSCKPDELHSSCLYCGATGLQEEEMKSHLGSRHGVVFQQEWKLHCSQHCRCFAKVQWGWGRGTEIQSVRPKLVRKILPHRSVTTTRASCDHDESETEGSCLETVGSGKQKQVLDSVEWGALKSCKLQRSCLEIGESGKEGQVLNSVVEETLKSSCKEVEMYEESSRGTLRSGKERRCSDLVEEEAVECYKEVAKFGSQGVLRLNGETLGKETLGREILYRDMLESTMQMRGKVIEKELTFSSGFTRALTDKGGKLAKSIRQGSGAYIHIYIPSVARGREKGRVVVRGHAEMVNKAEQMLEELLSSAVEIPVSAGERSPVQ